MEKSGVLEREDNEFLILWPALAVANILLPSLLVLPAGPHTLPLLYVSLTVKHVSLILSSAQEGFFLRYTTYFQSHPYFILLFVCLLCYPVTISMLLLRLVFTNFLNLHQRKVQLYTDSISKRLY